MKEYKNTKTLILDYLRDNPQACDTIEGIANWWVEEGEIGSIEKTVENMVGQNLLEKVDVYGKTLFTLSRAQ